MVRMATVPGTTFRTRFRRATDVRTRDRFFRMFRRFAGSESGRRARWLFVGLLGLLIRETVGEEIDRLEVAAPPAQVGHRDHRDPDCRIELRRNLGCGRVDGRRDGRVGERMAPLGGAPGDLDIYHGAAPR